MFVPRSVRSKGAPFQKKSEPPATKTNSGNDYGASAKNETSRKSAPTVNDLKIPKDATINTDSENLDTLLSGIELIFTDYAQQDPEGSKWLSQHYRSVGSEENYIHFSAILEHPNISTLKPAPSQLSLRQAIESGQTKTLELAAGGYHVRRKPSTYPLSHIPPGASSLCNDDGVKYWDERTIYVEPHSRHFCRTPARVAYWLSHHGQLREKWLPIQAVLPLYNSCAFVVLSGNVTHADMLQKWIGKGVPKDWRILSKAEHSKRTEEYLELLQNRNSKHTGGNAKVVQDEAATRERTHMKFSDHLKSKADSGDKEKYSEPDRDSNDVDDVSPVIPPTTEKKKRKRTAKKKSSASKPVSANDSEQGESLATSADLETDNPKSLRKHIKLSHHNAPEHISEPSAKSAKVTKSKEHVFRGKKMKFDD
ncbi:hypothetical protein BU24DRAFT_460241 [Aaosphaeria arxii CBS 175.79]|uniref:Uncharacterized protein n=1 Tax=Aaosphaeria arxii CBS 175.79 TaxID=1450172 RepID=A0A6A5XY14_9PLEO|nr:uncharacterized protein BU24DRAFT_460241 [Aaosphaeria arxii CBS 175.79]KAF2017164.1 hypothetical protein BU24DRAFT_460241 [Aaosphaeria arxii CBS 175.79]